MMRGWLLVLLLLASTSAAAQSFDAILDEADRIRTTDRSRFDVLLDTLDRQAARATLSQRMELRLLQAYQPLLDGRYEESIRELRELLAKHPAKLIRYRANIMLMTNHVVRGEYSDALQALEQVLAMRDSIDDPGFRQQGAIAAAILYNEVGQYRLAVQYAQEVVAHSETARNACIAGETLVDAKLNLSIPQSDESINLAIQRCRAIDEQIPSGRLVAFLARKWMSEGKNDDAIALLREQSVRVESTRYPPIVGELRATLAEALFNKGDLESAKKEAAKVVAIRSSIANTRPLSTAYKILSDVAVRQDDLKAALDAYRLYADVNKAYLTEIKTRALAYQLVRVESQQKNQQIELLNRQNNLLQLQQKVDQQGAENSRLLMLMFALLTATIAFWAYKTKRMQMSVKRMAETDALTGISNRHHFTRQTESTLVQCRLAGEPVAMLMFDLDYFKSINDSYGHVTGDWVLKRVAEVCAELCRKIDHLGRVGGEEFALLLHGSDLKAATRMAEDCRVRLSCIETSPSGYTFPVSASFGVSCSSISGYDLDKLISHADQMLYRAKREGRNRVRSYVPDVSVELTGTDFGKKSLPAMDAAGAVNSLRA
jgi:diguanylate cyclase (GGDEF)-like protein